MSSEPTLTLTIPRPCEMPKGHGIGSTGAYGDIAKARVTRDEYMLIDRVAAAHGLSVSMFIRWCAVYAARALEKEDERDDEPSSGT